ncbi:hypothetical protein H2199_001513 [Coniosporium tulheliwenetii]|uniref:Uncharacterized protein n=1 Tax=Coniosporium tulheliwenetii TaxID=3383036 RepID=A0ACC2ZJU0_9PEZI|nr:hypothetical protein H2199_001513 [Cladosporium sp. JES 115]
MAKTKPQNGSTKSRNRKRGTPKSSSAKPTLTPSTLLAQAADLIQQGQPSDALTLAQRALFILQPNTTPTLAALPALNLLGEINIELGDVHNARDCFTRAAELDPEGAVPESQGGGAEKFLWLAQLSEEGGADSVGGCGAEEEIGELEGNKGDACEVEGLEEKRKKLAHALCGVAEIYMTDLSWEEDAEQRCEALVTEALLVAPESPEPLQTLASVRISQEKPEDARAALARSMELWKDLDPADPKVPDFPTRISLARLLMEAEMEEDAIEVLERLITEDDSSIEAWYLGGWCLHLSVGKRKTASGIAQNGQDAAANDEDTVKALLKASREWLQNSLRLYQVLEYEDERLRDHALELVNELDDVLGPTTGDDEDEEEGDWEDADGAEDGEEDEEMRGA